MNQSKRCVIPIDFDPKDKEKLVKLASENGLSTSTYLRMIILTTTGLRGDHGKIRRTEKKR